LADGIATLFNRLGTWRQSVQEDVAIQETLLLPGL
jgi:hypothetical protein